MRVIKRFYGCADGQGLARWFKVGEEIEGDLARVAEAQGWAEKALPAPKNKAMQPPKNKSGAASHPGRPLRKQTARKQKG